MALSKEAKENAAMVGVLLDLSWSMKEIISENMHRGVKETRAHAMIDALTEIVKKESENTKESMLFTVAFGINCGRVKILDVLAAGDLLNELKSIENEGGRADRWTCKEILNEVKENGACYIFNYIREDDLCDHLSQKMAQTFLDVMRRSKDLTQRFAKTLPDMVQTPPAFRLESLIMDPLGLMERLGKSGFNAVQKEFEIKKPTAEEIDKHIKDAKDIFREEIDEQKKREIEKILGRYKNPKPRLMSEISRDLNPGTTSSKLHDYLEDLEPYIYGRTPMCAALKSALNVFKNCSQKRKILVIISDGEPTDGNPLENGRIAWLKKKQVLIISCLMTSDDIESPRELYSQLQESWSLPAKLMFQMSSNVSNQKLPRSLLAARGWRLPQSGTSNLFLQANHADVINEFTTLFTSLETNVDALVNIMGQVKIDDILNTRLHELEKKKREAQIGGTCYAHAIATVIYLATRRIVGYDEKRPSVLGYMKGDSLDFLSLLGHIVEEFGSHGANTEKVLGKISKIFGLHMKKASEDEARQALNKQRPLVARYALYENQWDVFGNFWNGPNHKRIMQTCDLPVGNPNTEYGGHAVTLFGIEGGALKLLNSWGSDWADRGFFRIADGAVLGVEFYDVFFYESELTQKEKDAWKEQSKAVAKDLSEFFPSCAETLRYQCPKCNEKSLLKDFGGDFLEAECPICKKKFKNAGRNVEIFQALYYRDN
eukprot:Seg7435.1 transcript_id=Seg7435.1/GoldUCD/mRNA.D3Y31 product="hypothetical protein" protein_id=Seg7435.1/GoldUCD/D3Y31